MPADPPPTPPFSSPPDVETMLRDAARRGRAGFDAAGPDAGTMPGPTRARLHAELARRFDAPPPARAGRWTRWWPAIVGAAGATAAVALFVTFSQRPPGTPSAANMAHAPAPPAPATAQPAPVVVAVEPPRPADAPPAAETSNQGGQVTAAAPVAPPQAKPDALAQSEGTVRTQVFTQTPPLPVAVFARRPAPAPGSPAARGRVTDAAAGATAATSVLGSFQFEQRGETVRVVDADGSVYMGQMEPVTTTAAAAAKDAEVARAKVSPSASEGLPKAGENFRFRATGDNRTLRRQVIFEGEYSVPASSSPEAPAVDRATARAPAPAGDKAPRPLPGPEAQIRGRVRVVDDPDPRRATDVDARSVEAR